MCLLSKKEHLKEARHNIIAYKTVYIFEGDIISPFMFQRYYFDELYKVELQDIYKDRLLVSKNNSQFYSFNYGFHSFVSKGLAAKFATHISEDDTFTHIAKILIPKGSFYIKGMGGDILSNQIKIISMYEINNRSLFGIKLRPKLVKLTK